jgi:selenide,water dikinase
VPRRASPSPAASVEPIYGLAVIGLCHPSEVRRNGDVKAGDTLILTKGIGVGIYSAAIKKNALPPGCYEETIGSTTLLNRIGADLAADPDVHAMTDVTGFGVLGHGLEMARASQLSLTLRFSADSLLVTSLHACRTGLHRPCLGRNWECYGADVVLSDDLPDWQRLLLADPQTSGGLLVACAPEKAVCWSRGSASRVTRRLSLAKTHRPE